MIVHRDLKPENIFIATDGQLKILDFGLAKQGRDEGSGSETALTRTSHTVPGTVMGTVGYMSPEQVRGQTVDARADLFAFGAILYEMVSGRRAFQRQSSVETMNAILQEEVDDLAPADIPPSLVLIVRRCLEKRVDQRFQSARDLAFALESLTDGTGADPTPAAGHPVGSESPSVAVLPFSDLSRDRDQEYFCDGMAEEIINALTRVKGLRVAARTSTFQFKGKSHDVRRIGETLTVSHLLEGSVRTAGDRLRVTAQLLSVADGFEVWSDRYDGVMADIFAIQDEIASQIVRALEVQLVSPSETMTRAQGTSNLEAYHAYLRGRHFWLSRQSGWVENAVACFEEACAHDPHYAAPHVGIADTFWILGLHGYQEASSALGRVLEESEKALALDPRLAAAHASLGNVKSSFEGDYEAADRHFRRALELDPSAPQTHCHYGFHLAMTGRFDEAFRSVRRARELDPLSVYVRYVGAAVQHVMGDDEATKAAALEALELDRDYAPSIFLSCLSQLRAGEASAAIEPLQRLVDRNDRHATYLGCLGMAYAEVGERDKAQAVVDELELRAASEYVSPLAPMMTLSALGRTEEALQAFERAVEERQPSLSTPSFGVFKYLVSEPRFRAALQRFREPLST